MKKQNSSSLGKAGIGTALLAATVLTTTIAGTATAKSLYVIADINKKPIPVRAYDIGVDGTLTLQAAYGIPRYGAGAVGLALDPDSKYLFVTYEHYSWIQLIDGEKMTDQGVTLAPSATNLAGIVYDHGKELLYCVDRGQDVLYVYRRLPDTTNLIHMPGSPFQLTEATAWGIALDEINDLLYVANNSTTINVYDTSSWELVGTISISRVAISIAVDAVNGFVYSGAGWANNSYLTQYNLATDTEQEVQVEAEGQGGVMGLAVDQATGFVYLTTGKNNYPGGDNLMAYDTSLNQIDFVAEVGNPTGMVIPTKDVSYNPLNLSKQIVGGMVDTNEPVGVRNTVTYRVCFDNKYIDSVLTNVSVVDTLAAEVSFLAADGDGVSGQYDAVAHTYTWFYSSLPQGSTVCSDLVVRVKEETAPGTIITNSVTIDSDQTPPTTRSIDAVVTAISYNPLNLTKTVVGSDGGEMARARIGENLAYRICFDNNDNDYKVTNLSLVDTLPAEANFVGADGDGVFGQYDAVTHTYTWLFPSLPPGSSTCLDFVVQVNEDTAPGTIVTNSVTIDSDQTESTTRSAEAIAEAVTYKPLNLSKSILGAVINDTPVDEVDCVHPGDSITYAIAFDNNDNDHSVTNVSVVDTLPPEVSFVSADGDGILGQYDPLTHSYTWLYPALLPGASTSLELLVQVKEDTAPGVVVSNSVTIDSNQTPPTTASVDITTCEIPLEAELCVIPRIIGRRSYGSSKYIVAIMALPQGVAKSDIEDEQLAVYPGGPEAIDQRAYDTGTRAKIVAFFDKASVISALPSRGETKLRIVGRLKSGQSFFGEQTVYITR